MASDERLSPSAEEELPSVDIDDRHLMLQVEQAHTQKRAFTNWINSQLAKHAPPSSISDLFIDITDGHMLLDLLEVLSGEKLTREKGSNTFQQRSNIETALNFLESKSVKVINVHVADILDGKPSIVLGLMWTIIWHFHIQELAGTLAGDYSRAEQGSVTNDGRSPTASPPAKKSAKIQSKWQLSVKKALLSWAKDQCASCGSTSITDFKSSWKNGVAFLGIIHALRPDLVDMKKTKGRSNRENLNEAFRIAEQELNIPRLLEPEDIDIKEPDEKLIMTYVAQFLQYSKSLPMPEEDMQEKVADILVWLALEEQKLKQLFIDTENESYLQRYQEILLFMKKFNDQKRSFAPVLSLVMKQTQLSKDFLQIKQALENLTSQIADWKVKLDHSLPAPLNDVEAWLKEVENLLSIDFPELRDHHKAMSLLQEKETLYKGLMAKFDNHWDIVQSFENKDDKGIALVPDDKVEEMKTRFNNIKSKDFGTFLEYYYSRYKIVALLDEVKPNLETWNAEHGTKESVESLLENWNNVTEKLQLEAAFQTFREMSNRVQNLIILAGDPQLNRKTFKNEESEISVCMEQIYNAKSTLQKIIFSWTKYMKDAELLKSWLDETQKQHPKKVPSEILTWWTSAHGSVNKAGNFLIEVSNQQVGSNLSHELKKLNKRWVKFIKRTKFEETKVKREQYKLVKSNTERVESHLEEATKLLSDSVDISTDILKKYIQNLKALQSKATELDFHDSPESSSKADASAKLLKEKLSETTEKISDVIANSIELLPNVEKIEELIAAAQIWISESEHIVKDVKLKGCTEAPGEEFLKDLVDRGRPCQEHVAAAEEKLQVLTERIFSQTALQHFRTIGLQTRIKEAKYYIQDVMMDLDTILHKSEPILSEQDVVVNFEKSQKELETYIMNAVHLLSQKMTPEECISQYEKNFESFDARSLDKFLKAANQMKSIKNTGEKIAVEEVSLDLQRRWEAVHSEISSYIQLKIRIEKGKFDELFLKLDTQIKRERELLGRSEKEDLIKEHKAASLQEASLDQLDQCMQSIRELGEKLTRHDIRKETEALIAECEQKREDLEKRVAAVRSDLQSRFDCSSSSRNGKLSLPISESGVKTGNSVVDSSKSIGPYSSPEASETLSTPAAKMEAMQPNRGNFAKNERETEFPLQVLLKRYDTDKSNLELHLQSNKGIFDSELPDKAQNVISLQNKLEELQVLQRAASSYWTQFEKTSCSVEKLVENTEKTRIAEERVSLKKEWNEFQPALISRMKSLKSALKILLPIESEAIFLCDPNEQPHEKETEQFTLTNIGSIFQELKDVQKSVDDQIELCSKLDPSEVNKVGSIISEDLQVTRSIMLQYKKQFEETNQKMQSNEIALKALEGFLCKLEKAKISIAMVENDLTANAPALQENRLKVEDVQKEISSMKVEAKSLDEMIKTVEISMEDPESRLATSCEDLITRVAGKAEAVHRYILLKEESRQQEDLQETFFIRHGELLKNIGDIHDQISKIGLEDPTVHAINLRIKSLSDLERQLSSYIPDKDRLKEMVDKLLKFQKEKERGAEEQYRRIESLWEETSLSLIEGHEECDKVIELLRDFQSCKKSLTALIRRVENAIQEQASYMGKDNLQRTVAKIEALKKELSDHSTEVDKVNNIGKMLQFQLNKMKNFEEPPFEKEVNSLVDRWLDINEKIENYGENMRRALALWEKLNNLINEIDTWSELQLKRLKEHHLTEKEVTQLEVELQAQEQKIEEFNKKSAEIQSLLQSNDPPLQLQVIKNFVLNKMQQIRTQITSKPEDEGETAGLKKDLDLARTQLGAIESFLNALSVLDNLDVFSTLESMHEQILCQKDNLRIFPTEGPNTDLEELKKQYKDVMQLFNTKKQAYEEHFLENLNGHQQKFDDWFSSARLALNACFDPSETKQAMEEKLHQLTAFLTSEERENLQQMKTVLSKVGCHLPKENVSQMNSYIVHQESELQQVTSKCQTRIKEIQDCERKFRRFQEDFSSLNKWLTCQEGKLQDKENKKQLENFNQMIMGYREAFDSLEQLANSLRELGFTEDEKVTKSCQLFRRYQALLTRVSEKLGLTQELSKQVQKFKEVAQSISAWIDKVRPSLDSLKSVEGNKSQLEEKTHQMKEIIALKAEGGAKIKDLRFMGESLIEKSTKRNENSEIQQTILNLQKEWEETMHSATEHLRDRYIQDKEDLSLRLKELQTKQELICFEPQSSLQEKQAQLVNCKMLLQEAEDLTPALYELKIQGDYLLGCTQDSCFEELWLEIKYLHEHLLIRLQDLVQKLKHQEHHEDQTQNADLGTEEDGFPHKLLNGTDVKSHKIAAEEKMQKFQELQRSPEPKKETSEIMLPLIEAVKQNPTPPGHRTTKDKAETLQYEHTGLARKLEPVTEETKNIVGDSMKSKHELFYTTEDKESNIGTEMQASTEKYFNAKENNTKENLKECSVINKDEVGIRELTVEKRGGWKEELVDLQQWLQKTRAELETYQNSPCGEDKLAEKISHIQAIHADIMQKQIDLDVIDSKVETLEREAQSEGKRKANPEIQGPKDQLQKLLLYCDSYKRQLASLQTDLSSCYVHLHEASHLLNSIQLKLSEGKQPSSKDREAILAEVQPLYDQVWHHFGFLDKICSQALSLKVSNNAEQERKKLREKWEPLMMHSGKELIFKTPLFSESQANIEIKEAEQKVIQLKNQAMELDIALANEQLEEIEKLYLQFTKKKDQALCLKKDGNLPNAEDAFSHWNRLLHELILIKDNKERLHTQMRDYHDMLAAVKSSVKTLSMEKENIKLGPMDSSVIHLERIVQFMIALQKEKDVLRRLRTEQENVSKYLLFIDRKITENQVKQLEQWWDQTEQSAERKRHRLAAEVDEFNAYMSKIGDLQKLLQDAQHLLNAQEENKTSAVLITKLQAIKGNFFQLKEIVELQMKQIWGQQEKETLENSINNLQKQLEVLEEQTSDKEETTSSFSEKSEFTRTLKETAQMKDCHNKIILDQTVSLFPDDIRTQVSSCKTLQSDLLNQKAAIESLTNEAKHFSLEMNQQEAADVSTLLQELQDSYQTLITKAPQRLQQLEHGLEKREKLFAELAKAHGWLQHLELVTVPDASKQITQPELDQQIRFLKEKREELEKIESLLYSLLKESQDFQKELNLFEQLFLAEKLRGLENMAHRMQRLVNSMSQQADKKQGLYMELSDRACALQLELNTIIQKKLEPDQQEMVYASQNIKEKLGVHKDRALEAQSTLSQMFKYKEIFEYAGLEWVTSPLDEIQILYFKVKDDQEEKVRQADKHFIESSKYQVLVNEIKILTTNIKKEINIVTKYSDLEATHLLCQRVRKVIPLIQEAANQLKTADVSDASLKENEVQQKKDQLEDMENIHQLLCNRILELQPRYTSEQDFQSRLEDTLRTMKQSLSELQQPLRVDLDINWIEDKKLKYEAFQERVRADMCSIKAVPVEGKEGLKGILCELNDHEQQLMTHLSSHVNALNETCETIKRLKEAVQRAVGFLIEFEANMLLEKVDLDDFEKSSLKPILNPQSQTEELESIMTELQDLTHQLENVCKPRAKQQLQIILDELIGKQRVLTEESGRRKADLMRYCEKYQHYKETKQKICADLKVLEELLRDSFSQTSKSYKDALLQLEQSKALVIKIDSIEKDLTKLRQDSRDLCTVCKEGDITLVTKTVEVLWDKWLYLLELAKEWEMTCEAVKENWKFVSEEIEREIIILDNFHEELPGSSKEMASKKALLESLECINRYEENIGRQQLLLLLLLSRVKDTQAASESSEDLTTLPAIQEIQSMQEKCGSLSKKAQKRKHLVQSEIQNRDQIKEEIKALMNSMRNALSHRPDFQNVDPSERATRLEELQDLINKEKLRTIDIMEKMRIKYSEMYTIVPTEIEAQTEECKRALRDMEDKIRDEVLQSSPQYVMNKKVEEINNGLQTVEKMLQPKSENLIKAKEIQKKIWDELDHWHSRLNELDSEVQDIAEEDPAQAQAWMDSLIMPFQLYQQVSKLSERRTALLNKGASKMEECDELLKNIKSWIENTNNLLTGETKYDSAKSLSKHASALQIALEDSEQKQNILHAIYSGLDELSIIFETNITAEKIDELNAEVTLLQQKIVGILPQLQNVADEVIAIESEVKVLEKKVTTIKTILSSTDVVDFSPRERLKHGQVILENIDSMKKMIAQIEACKTVLKLPEPGAHSLSVFKRAFNLSKCIEELEKVTKKQNELFEPVIKEVAELDQELEKLKQASKNLPEQSENTSSAYNDIAAQGNAEDVLDQMKKLSEKKEEVLTGMQNSLMELLKPLEQEQQELEDDPSGALTPEDPNLGNIDVPQSQVTRKGFLFLLPSLEEETEESSLCSEKGEEAAIRGPSFSPLGEEQRQGSQDSSALWAPGTQTDGIPQGERGTSEKRVDRIGETEPEGILHVCQAQAAELERWLDKVKLSLTEKPNPDMQQQVEQQLTDCQMTLREIEQKVSSLLEEGICWFQGDSGGTHRETEVLSLKLKALKSNLEKVQVMLQDKPSEEQLINNVEAPSEIGKPLHAANSNVPEVAAVSRPTLSRQNSLQQQKTLQMELHEQQDLTKNIAFYGGKMENQLCSDGTAQEPHSRSEVTVPEKELAVQPSTSKDYKWQYLQTELSYKMKIPPHQHAELQVTTAANISTLPRIPVYGVKYPTADEVKCYNIQLEDLSQEANVTQTQKSSTMESSSNLEGKLFELFGAIIQCLYNLEEMFNTNVLSNEDAVTQLADQEALSSELGKLHAEMMDRKDVLLKSLSCAGRSPEVAGHCFNSIQAWLKLTHATALSRSKSIKAGLEQNCNYQNEIRQLYDSLTDKRSILNQSLNDISSQRVAEQLQIMNMHELELQNFESQVTALRDKGERLQVPVTISQEVYKLEEALNDAWGAVRAKQLDLNKTLISESLCERLLLGIAKLVSIGEEKLTRSHSYRAKSKTALQLDLLNHKDFFHNLRNHMLLMQTFSARIPPSVFNKKEQFWKDLTMQVTLLQEHAVQHGIHLECLLKDWTEFDEDCTYLSRELATLESAVPSVSLVEETEERLLERISLFQQIKNSIDARHTKLCETLREGKKLATAVSCPELEIQISKQEEQWLSLTRSVSHELHRLHTLLQHLICYNKDSHELAMWLESAYQRLNYWKQESLSATQDLNTIKSNINSFYEFSREVDEKSSFKTSVIGTGNQLLRLKEADTAVLRSSLVQFEQKWADLIIQLPPTQEKLHELKMEKLPSREAIADLIAWMNHVNVQRKDEVPVDSDSSSAQVKNLLQEYQEHRRNMNHRQWIVDFVNQSLLQLSVCDIESNRYDRTDFAELLGTLNLQWHRLQGSLNKKIQDLEQMLENVTEKENKVQTLSSWFDAQGDKLKTLEKSSSLISAQKALVECEDLEKQLSLKSSAVEELKQNFPNWENDTKEASQDIAAKVKDLHEKWKDVTEKVMQLKSFLQSILQYWNSYVEACEKVQKLTSRLVYHREHYRRNLLSLEALRDHVKNLQCLMDEAENNEGSWAKLQAAINNLKNDCGPSVIELTEQKCKDAHARWSQINQDVAEELQSSKALLQLLETYTDLYTTTASQLEQLEEQSIQLSSASVSDDTMMEILRKRIQDMNGVQQSLLNVKVFFLRSSKLVDQLVKQAGQAAPDVILSDRLQLAQRISDLERRLSEKSSEFKFTINQLEEFNHSLEMLEAHVKTSSDGLDKPYLQGEGQTPEPLMAHLLALVALSPDIENLNEKSFRLPLCDVTTKTLQGLNRQWAQKTAAALEQCRELQRIQIEKNNFVQKCETWMKFLERMENGLAVDIAGNFEALQQQQKTYEMFQAEICINQQILNSVVTKALHLLDSGEMGDRTEFILKLTALKEKWQSVIKRVQQRKRDIDGLVKHWQHYSASLQNVTKCLTETKFFVSTANNQDCLSLHQMKKLIQDFQSKEVQLQRWQTNNWLVQETSKEVLAIADLETEATVQKELSQLQDSWKDVQSQVEKMIKQLSGNMQTWENCEKQIKELEDRLQDLKLKINVPLPEMYEDLQKSKGQDKELEESLADWNWRWKGLSKMKTDLSRCIIAEDVMMLKEQVEYLHRQWEDLCLRVALRKQEIEDRLNTWIVFDEKNKELCQWLTQMEGKALQTADISIEDMIEKLQKECIEEINLFSENKLNLKQMGDQLIKVSNATKSTEIENKLNKINDRWQHLFDVIGSRVKKLKETLVHIQQLDKDMSNLRTWLARIESELSKPVVYDICDDKEIKKKLAEQQDLQQDIEQHSAGVASVLHICEGLLNDSDACANETECDSIQQTTRSLDRRWRSICTMSMQRRMKIEETWQLWQKFLDDYSRFEDWLNAAERTAASPNSAEVLYTNAKEELKKFEAFQRQIHERLTQLELINKQYRRLARENRTDSASKLKQMVHEGNQRWDNLQKRVTAILRRLKHFTNQREEFEGTRESILVWLTEMDLQLTNVEHFSESDIEDKKRQLNGFQQEITLNTDKIDQLVVFGEQLIQKSEPMDAVLIEDELEELHKYQQEVFGRVSRFHKRLTSRNAGMDDERETSENEADAEDTREMQNGSWHEQTIHEGPTSQLIPLAPAHERSGRETPVSVDSIPLEWDHTVDVGGSSSHEDEDDATYYSALSGKSDSEAHPWHSSEKQTPRKHQYQQTEMIRSLLPPETSTPSKADSATLKLSSSDDLDNVQQYSSMLNEEAQNDQGLVGIAAAEKQSGVIERWEIIQAQALSNKFRVKQNLQQWQQLKSDLRDITSWLERTEKELDVLQKLEPATNLQAMEYKVKKLKETLKAFDNYKALVISANLSSKEFQQTDSAESKELQNRLRQVNLRWDAACHALESWKEQLQSDLMQCEDFHERSQALLMWLASAENRRCKAQITDPAADPHRVLKGQKELLQLEKELLERQPEVYCLQEIASYLLVKADGEDYVEADEKVHVIGSKLQQLLKQVSRDLKTAQLMLDMTSSSAIRGLDSTDHHLPLSESNPGLSEQKADGENSQAESEQVIRSQNQSEVMPEASRPRSFFFRVLRAALPLQLLFLLLLLLTCMVPFSEEDYSCTHANYFARSFYPMLNYTNGPPPT
ncbi:nesprin-2 isoform X2 [Rhinatrema bivittatum]|uniref:nesprin-2 isoform X2 n=1 Tax=Rhinatrema bivittatum TaxID=194408 RepID=UPI00112BA3E6|nr:nesprin-2 isoform X2 [Rhinatrema bivittatum]